MESGSGMGWTRVEEEEIATARGGGADDEDEEGIAKEEAGREGREAEKLTKRRQAMQKFDRG